MKNKLSLLFWGTYSIPAILLIIAICIGGLNSNIETIAFMWFTIQTLSIPIFSLIITIVEKYIIKHGQ